jgi:drug/metabolite transporter (DMT)-like permease
MAAWQVGASVIAGGVISPFVWVPPASFHDIGLLLLIGVVALAAIVLVNRALAVAPVSVAAPYQYTLIVWAVVFGYFIFGDVPNLQMLVGAAIIVAAGLYIFFREQKVGVESTLEAPPER